MPPLEPLSELRTISQRPAIIALNGATLLGDCSGALVWPERRALIVADLHFEKGSSFARGGTLLPPYDTRATLRRLADAIRRHMAETVICLGDSFHDGDASERLHPDDRALLSDLVSHREWIWVTGNHDPEVPQALAGSSMPELRLGPLVFRHAADDRATAGEVSGHFHPVATVRLAATRVTARCFVSDETRLILPAFGAFTGGLDVLDPAIAAHFPAGFRAHLLGRDRVTSFLSSRLSGTRNKPPR